MIHLVRNKKSKLTPIQYINQLLEFLHCTEASFCPNTSLYVFQVQGKIACIQQSHLSFSRLRFMVRGENLLRSWANYVRSTFKMG